MMPHTFSLDPADLAVDAFNEPLRHGYTAGMTIRVGPKGQVVVPKAIRDRIGLRPGDDVVVDEVAGEVRIRRSPTPEAFVGILGPPDGMRGWAEYKADEREREARREQTLNPEQPT